MVTSPKLTVIIPTLNEEKDLPETLKSLALLNSEIVVVDSGSSDKTQEIAKKFGAKFVFHAFESFDRQRNFGDSVATGDWILSLEADVTVSPELAKEIISAITTKSFAAYYISRLNNIWGKDILHTDWSPKDDTHIWLYRKGSGSWVSDVHEEYHLQKGQVGYLKNYLHHKNYETVSEFIEKLDKYSEIATKRKQIFPNYWPLREFFKRYFYKLGFLDGYHGLFLSYLQSIYYLTLSVKNKTQSS